MRGTWAVVAAVLTLGTGTAAAATPLAGLYQADGAQVRIESSASGNYLGNLAAAATVAGCAAPNDSTQWIIEPEGPLHGRSAKVYDGSCNDRFGTATFAMQEAGESSYLRVCVASPDAAGPAPASTAPAGTLPSTLGTPGCFDFKRISDPGPAIAPHTVGDYVKNVRRGRCVLKYGPTSFFVRITKVADDPAVRVLLSNNGQSAQAGQKSGKEYRFDLPAKKGANHVKVIVRTRHGKKYVKTKTLYC
jgi:hypothetical protein